MYEILERFIGRYQSWRDQRVQHNPLNIPALIVTIGIAQSAYNLLIRHNFTWWAGFVTVLNIAFLVIYFRKWSWAWLMLPIWGAMILVQLLSVFDLSSRYPPRVTVLSACLAFAFGAGFIAWGFAIRRRYYFYISASSFPRHRNQP